MSHWQKTKLKRATGTRKTQIESRFDIKNTVGDYDDDSITHKTHAKKENPKKSKRR